MLEHPDVITEHPYVRPKKKYLGRDAHYEPNGNGHAPQYLVKISRRWQRQTGYLAAIGKERCP